ncbi:MAG: hypothetical protein JWP25_4426 [Bradyrhizobium sp.]|nr:hypothetical protein [Bradyrhizobium sp.]
MSNKKIVLLSDGTGNSSVKVFKTNVLLLFQALDLTDPEKQIAYYDDGVGTSSFKLLAILGGVFGFGLKRNVIDIYSFCCRNYKKGDGIYGFGFSRGAFTIRVVAGFIARIGLVRYDGNEENLARDAEIAYREYRKAWSFRSISPLRSLRDWASHVIFRKPSFAQLDMVDVDRIEFLGVWDTVDAYGGPIEEITRAIDYWYWPLSMPDQFMNHKIVRACHALALEEEREAFRPVLWDDRYVREGGRLVPVAQGWTPPRTSEPGKPHIDDERISQVWFVGVHADIGGGYSRAGLAYWTLAWMIERSKVYGLEFQAFQEEALRSLADPYDKLNDSRHGLAGYYRYRPRRLSEIYSQPPYKLSLADDTRRIVNLWRNRPDPELEVKRELASPEIYVPRPPAKIHSSVLDRIAKGTDGYAPIVLPAIYSVVGNDGSIATNGARTALDASRVLREERVWNWVWARRVIYFLTVFAALFLAALPLIDRWRPGRGPASPFEIIVPLIDLVGAFLPGFANPWLEAFRISPGRFLGGAIVAGVLVYIGGWMQGFVRDLMRRIWRTPNAPARRPTGFVYRLRTAGPYLAFFYALKHRILPFIFAAIGFVCLAPVTLALVNRVSFTALDLTGQVCTPSRNPSARLVVNHAKAAFDTATPCTATGLEVEQGKSYRITLVVTDVWEDGYKFGEADPGKAKGIETDPRGFGFDKMRWQMALGLPIRRLVGSNWFAPILRVGNRGFGETVVSFAREDSAPCQCPAATSYSATFRARKNGELFVYVNDAVIGIPGHVDTFYKNNKGKADLILQVLDE